MRPSFLRTSVVLIGWIILVVLIGYLWGGYFEHDWSGKNYKDLTLVIPITVMVLFVWFVGVPRCLEFSASEFTIKSWLRRPQSFSWDELDLYLFVWGDVFIIQFVDNQSFQIFPFAYPRKQWRQLRDFISTRFPDRKASGYFGAWLFKWRRKRKPR